MRYVNGWLCCLLTVGFCLGCITFSFGQEFSATGTSGSIQLIAATRDHASAAVTATLATATSADLATTRAAATTEDSVKMAVNELFIAMKNADAARLRSAFTDSALLQTIVTDKEGRTSVRNEAIGDFASSIGKLPPGAADERIQFDVVKVDGPLAIVWAPYRFYYKGTFSHCGVDSFQLLRTAGGWKILYIIDTRRKEGCE